MKKTTIQVRVSEEEKTAFSESANISGIKLASWVRERLRLAATKDLAMAGKRPEFLTPPTTK